MKQKNTEKARMRRPDTIEFEKPIPADSSYSPTFDDALLKHLSKGLSFASFDVGVTTKTLHAWQKRYPSFSLARERGEKKRLQLLEAAGMKMILDGNATAWKFMMQDYGMIENVSLTLQPGNVLPEDDEDPLGIIDVTPERQKRINRIRELGRKLKLK